MKLTLSEWTLIQTVLRAQRSLLDDALKLTTHLESRKEIVFRKTHIVELLTKIRYQELS